MKEKQKIATICPYCGCGCGLYVVVENDKAVNIDYLSEHPLTQGALCPKGNAVLDIIYHRERLHRPLKKENATWVEITWDEAIRLVTDKFKQISKAYGANALGFLSSAKCTNEENYLLSKLARLLGTNNIDHCVRLCHAPTLTGLVSALGSGAMTNPITDLTNSSCIFIVGSNVAENHPIVCRWILDAKEKGAKVIIADPRYTPTAWMADIFLQLRPGTDAALINGMLHTTIEEDLYDRLFISSRTEGFEELCQTVSNYPPEKVMNITGVPGELIQEAARIYAKADASAIIYCMGITQHTLGHSNVVNLANLSLVCGQVGRPGAGILPLRGQNNVQGACDMGALPDFLPGYVPVTDEVGRRRIAQQWGVEDLPLKHGLTAVEMMNAIVEGKIKAMFIVGEETVSSNPNSNYVRKALENLEFLVVEDIFLTETAKIADLILPATSWAEKEGSITSMERRVQWTHQAIKPVGDERADWETICQIGNELGFGFDYCSADDILHEVNRVIPSYAGIAPERIKETVGGIIWPCPSTGHSGTPLLYEDAFGTPLGKGRIMPVEYEPMVESTESEYHLILITGRVVMHYNSGSMSRRTRSLLKRTPELFVEINPLDAEKIQISDGERVVISTKGGEITANALITQRILPGVIFVPFHFSGVNALTADTLDPQAKVPELKITHCKITKPES